VTSEPRGVSIYADEERAYRKNEYEKVSGVKPSTWAPRCDPGLVSSPGWSGQGFFRASPCPARKDSSSRAPSSSTLTPQSETCEPWRQQALACHVFDGPHAAAPQHGACHTAFRSILAHILSSSSSLWRLCISTTFRRAEGHVWLAVLAVCRRPAAYSSVGPLGRESQKGGTSGVGPCSGLYGQKARAV
jgi:hypothetical protein